MKRFRCLFPITNPSSLWYRFRENNTIMRQSWIDSKVRCSGRGQEYNRKRTVRLVGLWYSYLFGSRFQPHCRSAMPPGIHGRKSSNGDFFEVHRALVSSVIFFAVSPLMARAFSRQRQASRPAIGRVIIVARRYTCANSRFGNTSFPLLILDVAFNQFLLW